MTKAVMAYQAPPGENPGTMRMWRSGSATPCQGVGRGFDPRYPLAVVVQRQNVTFPR